MRSRVPAPRRLRCGVLAALLTLLAAGPAPAAERLAKPQSGQLHAELVTFHPGDDLWSRFGHIGVRVIDTRNRRDILFDFGRAPFDKPGFLIDYLRGSCAFYLDVKAWDYKFKRYRSWNRTIVTQRLNLDHETTFALVRRLIHNAHPDRREYIYDQLEDNCSTRLRDLLDDISQGALRRAVAGHPGDRTYRDYTWEHGAGHLTVQLGIDFLSGPNHDRKVSGWAELYLPLYLQKAASKAMVTLDGKEVPLAGEPQVLYQRQGEPAIHGSPLHGRHLVVGLSLGVGLLLLLLGWLGRRSAAARRAFGGVTLLVGLVFGLLGVVLTFMAFVSTVPDYSWSDNTLVLLPLDLGLVVTGLRWAARGRRDLGPRATWYLRLRLGLIALLALVKVLGITPYQDNWPFMLAAFVVLAGMAAGAELVRRSEPRPD